MGYLAGAADKLGAPGVALFLLIGIGASVAFGLLATRRWPASRRAAAVAALLSVTAVVTATWPFGASLIGDGSSGGMSTPRFVEALFSPAEYAEYLRQVVNGFEYGSGYTVAEAGANVLLFVPFGLFAVFATRRYVPVLLAGVALSVGVETVQSMSYRAATVADVVNNSAGTLAGVLLGAFAVGVATLAGRSAKHDRPRQGHRLTGATPAA